MLYGFFTGDGVEDGKLGLTEGLKMKGPPDPSVVDNFSMFIYIP